MTSKSALLKAKDLRSDAAQDEKLALNSSVQIWKSKISWRIMSAVFLTFMAVQAGILSVTIAGVEQKELAEIEHMTKTAILSSLNSSAFLEKHNPISDTTSQNILSKTPIKGFTVVDNSFNYIQSSGQTTITRLVTPQDITKTRRSSDNNFYEFSFPDNPVAPRYYIIARVDSSDVQLHVYNYVWQSIWIMLCLSGFVTAVLMIALSRWLLEPLLFMRKNLIAASENPEKPNIPVSPFNPNDEMGNAIQLTQNLIYQNADNLNHVRSTAEDKIHKLAYYDTLTTLPNRTFFLQALADKMKPTLDGEVKRFAVVTLDLDHFKDINDSMGHNVGDAILRGVGKRLRASLPKSATVSRSGEDEFAILMPLSTDLNKARDVAERIKNVIRGEPFRVFNEEFQIRASIGVSVFPDDGKDPDLVLKNADIALNRAKEEGRDTIKEYSEDFNRAVQERFQMLRDLRDALENDQLSLHFQPQLDLKTGKIIGAEALIRWWKPDNSKEGGHFIPPFEFIPIAEQSGLILPIGEWVLEKACRMAQEWKKKHGIEIRIAVNVSPMQFTQSDLVAYTKDVLLVTKLNPRQLELEVTESIFMDDMDGTIQTLKELNELGVELAIDDFGTGYSSLSYLRLFPIDRLKIDQAFIRNALNNADDAAITRTIIALGHALNLQVIAEGVETLEHEEFLIKEGCDEVQGYRYSKPVPAEDFVKFAKNYNGDIDSFKS